MMKKPVTTKAPAEQVVKDIRRATRKLHSSEEKIRIVLSGLRGEDSIAELCRTSHRAVRPVLATKGNLTPLSVSVSAGEQGCRF
jgi:hypothetical protein